MKILYLGPYRDGTGWAHAAIENILALDAAGIEVVPRAVKLNGVNGELPKRLVELEKESDKGCNIVIQNSLPHHFDASGDFDKSICYYFTETSHFRNSSWAERINLMDEAWVPCQSVHSSSIESKVNIPIKVIPVPCDTSKYQKKYEKFSIPQTDDRFTFYTIGEIHRRKNLVALLKAFHLEFAPDEQVSLVIKGSIPGLPSHEVDKHISAMCNTVKDELKLYRKKELYHSEVIISQSLTEEQIMRMHSTFDCYVSPSFGEGWNMPAFDAMAMGKTPICSAQGGPIDFLAKHRWEHGPESEDELRVRYLVPPRDINGDTFPFRNRSRVVSEHGGWLVPGNYEPVFGMKDTFPDLFVGNEEWFSINIKELRKAMRSAFQDNEERKKRAEFGMNRAYDFSHVAVGETMRKILNGEQEAVLHNWFTP